jgi:hypothetical protein
MSDPKFSIGDKVAICTPGLYLVIPETVITDRWFLDDDVYVVHPTMEAIRYSGWVYTFIGHHKPTREKNIRPLLPGEYLTTSEESHSGIPA